VLVATPASLQAQWRDEMWSKFALPFEVVDRDSTARLRRELGVDANPWRSHSRVITSYYYLKQPDVLEAFRAASRVDQAGAQLPWDLLIVDEAHNLTPPPFGDESDLCRMLRQIAPFFEHKLFLTATPHNGHTRSFTGLLELLDPVRFSQTAEMSDAEKARVPDVRVRRLKRQINEASPVQRFCDRLPPKALVLALAPGEKTLSAAFDAFRKALRVLVREAGSKRRLAGNFAIEILGKRLLSCPVAFADSWHRCRAGMQEAGSSASDQEVLASGRSLREEAADDREATSLGHAAAATVGAWLIPYKGTLVTEIEALDQALRALDLRDSAGTGATATPAADSRWQALVRLISEKLRQDGKWSAHDRLVVFTEYKTTLDYLVRRLRAQWPDAPERVLSLYGGMEHDLREDVKKAFNDPANPVRVLVATDAASEGLNLQETARYLLHFDVPWNPARLEQRNGRLDRHGPGPRRADLALRLPRRPGPHVPGLGRHKVHTIREDLGATGEVFDELTFRRLVEGEDLATVRADVDTRVDRAVAQTRSAGDGASDDKATLGTDDPAGDLVAIAAELDYDPAALRETLDAAMAIRAGRPRVTEPDTDGRAALVPPHPPAWGPVIDDSLRTQSTAGVLGALRRLAFDPTAFVVTVSGRPVFRPRPDTALMHLAHPMLQRTLSSLTRLRFPGSGDAVASRWAVGRAKLPPASRLASPDRRGNGGERSA